MRILRLIISIAICQLAGILGALFTTTGAWYENLIKPAFNPPNYLFGPVWITLYTLMGISLYLIWSHRPLITIFAIQLFLNTIWSPLFFGLHQPWLAFIDIILLWVAIIACLIAFYRVSKPAALLFIPYLLWVSFAAVLNIAIAILN